MIYRVLKQDGYILSVGGCGEEISKAEYNALLRIIRNRPVAPEGYGLRLRTDLTWEQYELSLEEEADNEHN